MTGRRSIDGKDFGNEGHRQGLWGFSGCRSCRFFDGTGRDRCHHRTVRLRQKHLAALHQRPEQTDLRRSDPQGRDRHGVSALQSVPAHDLYGEYHLCANQGQKTAEGGGTAPWTRAAQDGRTGKQGRCLSGDAVRRSEAAGRDCPRAGDVSGFDALRRGNQRAGSGDYRRGFECYEKTG